MLRSLQATLVVSLVACAVGEDLIMSGGKVTLGGKHVYDKVNLTNGAIINVLPYNGDIANTGILEIQCNSFYMDATAVINAKGAGYRPRLCDWGEGPDDVNDANPEILQGFGKGGRGGCYVRDSGGGGGHFGTGGPGTKDCTDLADCPFPAHFEVVCQQCTPGTGACSGAACNQYEVGCPNYATGQGIPNDSGPSYHHSVYDVWGPHGMGAAGGDKGCRDGDGWTDAKQSVVLVGAHGGGRVIINCTGMIEIYGKVTTDGNRGCGEGNDSGGGGAGGTVFIISPVGLNIDNRTTLISSKGGLGGDSQPKSDPECAGTQLGGTCDDCGGGGAGGLIYLKVPFWKGNYGNFMQFDPLQVFPVDGALGGACDVCKQEARGGDGLVVYWSQNEWCNGKDDSFDGEIDENLTMDCGGVIMPACINGTAQQCPGGSGVVTASGVVSGSGVTSAGGNTASGTGGNTGGNTAGNTAGGSGSGGNSGNSPVSQSAMVSVSVVVLAFCAVVASLL